MKFNINESKKEKKEKEEEDIKFLMTLSIKKLKDIIEDEIYEDKYTTSPKLIKNRDKLTAELKKTKTKSGLVKLIKKYKADRWWDYEKQ